MYYQVSQDSLVVDDKRIVLRQEGGIGKTLVQSLLILYEYYEIWIRSLIFLLTTKVLMGHRYPNSLLPIVVDLHDIIVLIDVYQVSHQDFSLFLCRVEHPTRWIHAGELTRGTPYELDSRWACIWPQQSHGFCLG